MSIFFNPDLASLEAYTPGEQPQGMKYIKLNTNESPYPPSPEVAAALSNEEVQNLRLYPDPDCRQLKEALASMKATDIRNIFISNGSDDILNFAFLAFAGGGGRKVFFPDITYGFYQVFADLHGISAEIIPLQEDFSINIEDYCSLPFSGGLICIANPNAPTGIPLTTEDIEKILLANLDKVVLIDEAYVDFGAESALPLIRNYDNLLVVQTFSKSRSMAGARLGFAAASSPLIDDLERIRFSTNPYNINRLTMAAGIAAIKSGEYFMDNCAEIQKTRSMCVSALESMGFEVVPSKANFIFVCSKLIDGEFLYNELKRRGILIRHFNKERIRNYNRITIGTPEEMDILLNEIRKISEEVSL